jgi:hypothetical protein
MGDVYRRNIEEKMIYVPELGMICVKNDGLWCNISDLTEILFDGYAPAHIRYFTTGDDLDSMYNSIRYAHLEPSKVDDSVYNYFKTDSDITDDSRIDLESTVGDDYYDVKDDIYSVELVSMVGITELKHFVPDDGEFNVIINCDIKLNNYDYTFSGKATEILGLENVDFKDATSLYRTFDYTRNNDFSGVVTTDKCTSYEGIFKYADTTGELNISNLNWENITYTKDMFYRCVNVTNIIGTIDTRNIASSDDKDGMFGSCDALVSPTQEEIDALMADGGALWTSENGIIN